MNVEAGVVINRCWSFLPTSASVASSVVFFMRAAERNHARSSDASELLAILPVPAVSGTLICHVLFYKVSSMHFATIPPSEN